MIVGIPSSLLFILCLVSHHVWHSCVISFICAVTVSSLFIPFDAFSTLFLNILSLSRSRTLNTSILNILQLKPPSLKSVFNNFCSDWWNPNHPAHPWLNSLTCPSLSLLLSLLSHLISSILQPNHSPKPLCDNCWFFFFFIFLPNVVLSYFSDVSL